MSTSNETQRFWVNRLVHSVLTSREWIDSGDMEIPHQVFGNFAVALREGIGRGTVSSETLEQTQGLFAEMADSRDDDTLDLLGAGALEVLADSRGAIEVFRPMTHGRLRNVLDYTILTWNGSDSINWRLVNLDTAPDEATVLAAIGGMSS